MTEEQGIKPVEGIPVHTDEELIEQGIPQAILGEAFEQLKMFHMKLKEEGEPRGLIGPRDIDILWERHILNSAAIVPFVRNAIEQGAEARVADIGSGGGFPGIVAAACMPDVSFTLIEPMERRVEWLNECVELLELDNVRVIRARSEEIIEELQGAQKGKQKRSNKRSRATRNTANDDHHSATQKQMFHVKPFGVVTCRAVARMTVLSAWTLPLLAPKGQLVALKGRTAQAELDKAAKEIAKLHGSNARAVEAPVAEGLEPTHVVLVNKC